MSLSNTGSSDAVASIGRDGQRGATVSLGSAVGGVGLVGRATATATLAGGIDEHAARTAPTTGSHTSHDFTALRRVGPSDRAGRNERSRILRA
jgi:hypothetical protein